jgi:hypothetical protein
VKKASNTKQGVLQSRIDQISAAIAHHNAGVAVANRTLRVVSPIELLQVRSVLDHVSRCHTVYFAVSNAAKFSFLVARLVCSIVCVSRLPYDSMRLPRGELSRTMREQHVCVVYILTTDS